MADPFAVEGSRLDEQFTFANRDRVRDELRQLVQILEARLQKIETGPQKTYAEELLALQANARTAVNDALTPFFEDLSNIASLGGIFVGTSLTTVVMALGPKTFTIEDEAARARFAPTTYMAAQSTVDPTKIMLGQVTDYDNDTGDLTITVSTLGGAPAVGETYASWNLLPTPPPTTLPYVDGGVFGGMDATGITRTPIRFRRSNIATDAPLAANLLDGELGINYRDNRLFWRGEDASIRGSKLFVGDISDVALRGDTDQFASWTTARRNQALRNLRRQPSYQTVAWTVDAAADMGKLFIYESQANVACTLPSLATAGDGFFFELQTLNLNNRGGFVTLTPNGTDKIEGATAAFDIPTGQTVRVVADTAAARGWRILGLKNRCFLQRQVLAAPAAAMTLLLPEGYRSYNIKGHGIINGSGSAVDLWFRASQDWGSTWAATSGNYFYSILQTGANGASPTTQMLLTASGLRVALTLNNTSFGAIFDLDFDPGRVSPKAHASWRGGSTNGTPVVATTMGYGVCAGSGLGTNINGLQFSFDSGGNINAGAVIEMFGVI